MALETPADRYDSYCEALERDAYASHAGLARRSVPLADDFGEFTSGDVLDELRREVRSATGAEVRSVAERLVLNAEECVLRSSEAASREALAREVRQGREATSLARRCELLEERFAARAAARKRLGYATGLERARALRPGVDLAGWRQQAELYLERTESVYLEEMRAVLPKLGAPGSGADVGAVAHIDHLGGMFDVLFPPGRALECLGLLLAPMGIDPLRRGLVRMDAEEREGRVPGVAVFAPRIPGDVVVSSGISHGPSAYVSTFFAMGRALAAAHTAESLPAVRRRPFDRALERSFGWLLSDRFSDPVWLAEFPSGRHAEALLRALRFRALFAERRAVGRLCFGYELAELSSGADPRRLSGAFETWSRRATHLAHPPELYLEGQEGELSPVDELRGRSLARALVEHLRERFGWQFWKERGAGELLRELWNTGSTYSAEGLADELGLGSLDLSSWIDSAVRGV